MHNLYSVFNICSGEAKSAEEIVQTLSVIKSVRYQIKTNKSLFRSDEIGDEFGSYEKIKNELGWKPMHKIEDGLNSMINRINSSFL